MSPENFAYWLNGFVELTQGQTPNPAQWKSIKEHLDLVFKKVTPSVQTGPSVTPTPIIGPAQPFTWPSQIDWTKTVVTC